MPFIGKTKQFGVLGSESIDPMPLPTCPRGDDMLSKLIPEIEETHQTAEQFPIPGLFQLKINILGTAAKDMHLIEEVM